MRDERLNAYANGVGITTEDGIAMTYRRVRPPLASSAGEQVDGPGTGTLLIQDTSSEGGEKVLLVGVEVDALRAFLEFAMSEPGPF